MDNQPARIAPVRAAAPVSMWDANQVAEYLHVSRAWVYRHAELGQLPVIRYPQSSLLRFDPKAIEAYARGEWKPQKPLPIRRAG